MQDQDTQYIVGGRCTGKTTRLLEWVAAGEPRNGYPFWSRVLVVHSLQEVMRLRSIIRADPERPLFEDDPHRLYHLDDWRTAHLQERDVEVALDNLDLMIAHLVGPGRLSRASMTGTAI